MGHQSNLDCKSNAALWVLYPDSLPILHGECELAALAPQKLLHSRGNQGEVCVHLFSVEMENQRQVYLELLSSFNLSWASGLFSEPQLNWKAVNDTSLVRACRPVSIIIIPRP